MNTLDSFIERHGIKASAVTVDRNPHMLSDEDWARTADHYRVTLKMGRKRMTVPFSMGSGLCREPSAADVLDCLASDACTVENAGGFEDWCAELGFDADSRRAERVYRATERQSKRLAAFLGPDLFTELVYNTERL